MSKLFHIIKRGLTNKQCCIEVKKLLDDPKKWCQEIKLIQFYSNSKSNSTVDLIESHFKREG